MKKHFKKSTIVLLAILTYVILGVTTYAAGKWVQAYQDNTLKISFNGVNQTFTEPNDGSKIIPLIYNGRTYLPLRAIAGLTGLGVDYNDATNTVLLTSGLAISNSGNSNNTSSTGSIQDLSKDPNFQGVDFKNETTLQNSSDNGILKGIVENVLKSVIEGNGKNALSLLYPNNNPFKESYMQLSASYNNLKANGKTFTVQFESESITKVGYKNSEQVAAVMVVKYKITDQTDNRILSEGTDNDVLLKDSAGNWYYYCTIIQS